MVVGEILHWIFTYILYPAVVLTTFLALSLGIVVIIRDGAGFKGVAAFLIPVVSLIFVVTLQDGRSPFIDWLAGFSGVPLFIAGAILGVLLAEGARFVIEEERAAALIVLIFSGTLCFFLYVMIDGSLNVLQTFLFGGVLSALSDVLVR